MRIALDAMGSDHAPGVDVRGAVRAARRFGYEITLVGREPEIRATLAQENTEGLALSVVNASQVVDMAEHPAQAVRAKKDASIVVAMGLIRDGAADALVSAGNSGGVLAASLASAGRIGRIQGVQRPAISTILPTLQGPVFMLDIGANTDCKPEWLVQFAIMGAAYAEHVLRIERPRVALLSNGEEKTKGSALVQETHELLARFCPDLNLIGNAEGKDITQGLADVIVTDGFTGNVAVKTAEGTASMLLKVLSTEIKSRPLAMLGGLLAKPAFRAVRKRLDYREYGGGLLLGVNGIVVIAHGRSDELAIENAIGVAGAAHMASIVPLIAERISAVPSAEAADAG
ncbi:MAG: phosphate acyltransferase PlsX [Chloroflexi bacterium]|nr:phosphate acyltransferase PlsX [Chloroflexota bacterium]